MAGTALTFLWEYPVLIVDIPLALWVLKTSPAELGLYADGIKPSPTEQLSSKNIIPTDVTGSTNKNSLSTLMKQPVLWLLCIGIDTCLIGEMSIMNHEAAFITDMGYPCGSGRRCHKLYRWHGSNR